MWTHKDVVQNVFTFQDLIDVHELLDIKEANEAAFLEYKQRMDSIT